MRKEDKTPCVIDAELRSLVEEARAMRHVGDMATELLWGIYGYPLDSPERQYRIEQAQQHLRNFHSAYGRTQKGRDK